jgi:hypothetical protein
VHGAQFATQARRTLCRHRSDCHEFINCLENYMRRANDWLHYANTLSDQGRDLVGTTGIYAVQWAHDVRVARKGDKHRRVGQAEHHAHEEWLQAGVVAHPPRK